MPARWWNVMKNRGTLPKKKEKKKIIDQSFHETHARASSLPHCDISIFWSISAPQTANTARACMWAGVCARVCVSACACVCAHYSERQSAVRKITWANKPARHLPGQLVSSSARWERQTRPCHRTKQRTHVSEAVPVFHLTPVLGDGWQPLLIFHEIPGFSCLFPTFHVHLEREAHQQAQARDDS